MNPFYERFQQKQTDSNPFSSPKAFQNAVNKMMANLNQMGLTPQARVQQLLQSGAMSQQEFNRLSQIANQITGRTR